MLTDDLSTFKRPDPASDERWLTLVLVFTSCVSTSANQHAVVKIANIIWIMSWWCHWRRMGGMWMCSHLTSLGWLPRTAKWRGVLKLGPQAALMSAPNAHISTWVGEREREKGWQLKTLGKQWQAQTTHELSPKNILFMQTLSHYYNTIISITDIIAIHVWQQCHSASR